MLTAQSVILVNCKDGPHFGGFSFLRSIVWGKKTNPPVSVSIRAMRNITATTTCTIHTKGGGTGIREMIHQITANIRIRISREMSRESMEYLYGLDSGGTTVVVRASVTDTAPLGSWGYLAAT